MNKVKISLEWDKETELLEVDTEGTTADIVKAIVRFIAVYTETAVPREKVPELRRMICQIIQSMPAKSVEIKEFSSVNLRDFQRMVGKEGEE